MTVVFAPQALLDLENLHAYVARMSRASQASVTLARIRKSINRLELFPFSGRAGSVEGTRELVVSGLPYRVVYQLVRNQVVIERVLHTSQQWPPANEPR
jgi:addiction module RelE/StbE family toxin